MIRYGMPRGPWRLMLLASLAVNLVLILSLGGGFLGYKPPRKEAPEARIERLAATLPRPDGDLLRTDFQAAAPEATAAHKALDEALATVRDSLRAQPFDAEAFVRALNESRARRQALYDVLNRVLTQAAPKMSPEGRAALAEWPHR